MSTVPQTLLSNVFHVMLYVTIVYLLVILGDWFTIYYKDPSNPVLLFAYMSMIHLISLPMLFLSLRGKTQFFWFFIFLNACWLIMTVIAVGLVYSRECE